MQTLDYDEDYEPMHFDMYGWALRPVQEVAAEPVAQQPKDGIYSLPLIRLTVQLDT